MSFTRHRLINRFCLALSALAAIMLLSSCGFALRGQQIPASVLPQLHVSMPQLYSPLHSKVSEYFIQQGLPDSINGEIKHRLMISPESVDRRLLSVFSTGQVAEYELIYLVKYQVRYLDNDPLVYSFTLLREYQDDPRQVLAKTRELNLVLDELRQEAADTIYRRLPGHIAQISVP